MTLKLKTSSLMLTRDLMPLVAAAKANDCEVAHDTDAGTIDVKDGEAFVLRAIQKGDSRQPWIVLFYETARISWGYPS